MEAQEVIDHLLEIPGECWDALATLDGHGITVAGYGEMLAFMGGGDPEVSDTFDRTLCPPPCNTMHSYEDGARLDPCPHDDAPHE